MTTERELPTTPTWDVVVAALLLGLMLVLAAASALLGGLIDMAPTSAATDAGRVVTLIGPFALFVVAVALTVLRVRRGSSAWPVPLVMTLSMPVPLLLGFAVASSG